VAVYSDFTTPWNDFKAVYGTYQNYIGWLDGYGIDMITDAASGEWNAAFNHALQCFNTIESIHSVIFDMVRPSWQYNHFFSSIYYAWNEAPAPPAYELTMDAILSTMLSADPSQVMYFMGLLDAYKQSVWSRPFNKEFFAALARGFEEWP